MSTDRRQLMRNALTLGASGVTAVLLWSTELPAADWRAVASAPALTAGDLTQLLTHAARATATGLLAYLMVASSLNLVASIAAAGGHGSTLVRWSGRLTPRWLAVASVGALASSTLLVPAAGAATDDGAGARRTDVQLEVIGDADPAATAPRTMLPWAPPATARVATVAGSTTTTIADPPRLSPVGAGSHDPGDAGSNAGAGGPAAAVGPDQLPPPLVIERQRPAAGATHTVRTGEHFWSIAQQVVADRGVDVAVGQYWRLLVEANRSRLVDPDDPDLLYPGQVLVLP